MKAGINEQMDMIRQYRVGNYVIEFAIVSVDFVSDYLCDHVSFQMRWPSNYFIQKFIILGKKPFTFFINQC